MSDKSNEEERQFDLGYSAGYAQGQTDSDRMYETAIESMRYTITRLKESNALICELVQGYLKESVADRIRKHAYGGK